MKTILASLVLVSSLAAISAFAEVEVAPSRCDLLLRLSDSQKLEIKDISKATAEKLKTLAVDIQKAKSAADAVLLKIEASKEEAALASSALAAKLNEVQELKHAERIAVLFDVLTPEQRIKKLKCEKAQHPARRGHLGQRPLPPHRPGRIEPRPAPHHRPGRVIITRPAPHSRPGRVIITRPVPGRHHPVPRGPVRPRRGGGGGVVII